MSRTLFISVATVALVASGVCAHASCGDWAVSKSGNPLHIVTPRLPPRSGTSQPASNSIVGLWQVEYSAGGNLVYQGFEQWHSDGLEWEFADIPTITGDVCMGVWSLSGTTISLYHTGWTFDSNGNPNGTMVLTHADTLKHHGSKFEGTFDLKFFDVNGNLVNEVAGDDKGTRIPAP